MYNEQNIISGKLRRTFFVGLFILLGLSCNSILSQEREKNIQFLIDKHIEAMGGKILLNTINSFYTLISCNEAIIESSYIRGRAYRQDITENGSTIITVYHDGQAVRCDNGKLLPITSLELWNYEEDSFIFKLFDAKQRGWEFSIDPVKKSDNDNYYIVGINTYTKEKMKYSLDRKTFLLSSLENEFGHTIEYLNYQRFDGLYYPTEFKLRANDFSVIYEIKRIVLNEVFHKERFNLDTVCQ